MPEPLPDTDLSHREPAGVVPFAPVGYTLLATYGQRVGGFLIDIGIPGGMLSAALIASMATRNDFVIGIVYPGAGLAGLGYLLWNSGHLQGHTGQSLGNRALGTRLAGSDGAGPVGFGRAVGRQCAHLVDGLLLGLGYLWPLWDERRQTFADKFCDTVVVQVDL